MTNREKAIATYNILRERKYKKRLEENKIKQYESSKSNNFR